MRRGVWRARKEKRKTLARNSSGGGQAFQGNRSGKTEQNGKWERWGKTKRKKGPPRAEHFGGPFNNATMKNGLLVRTIFLRSFVGKKKMPPDPIRAASVGNGKKGTHWRGLKKGVIPLRRWVGIREHSLGNGRGMGSTGRSRTKKGK